MTKQEFLDDVLDQLATTIGEQADYWEDPDEAFNKRHLYVAASGGVRGATVLSDPSMPVNLSQITGIIAAITADLTLDTPRMVALVQPGAYSKSFRKWMIGLTDEPSEQEVVAAIKLHKAIPCMFVMIAVSDGEPTLFYSEYLTHAEDLYLSPPVELIIDDSERAVCYSIMATILTNKVTDNLAEVN